MLSIEEIRLLKEKLHAKNIPFRDEHELRALGYDKTPDVKLELPCVFGNDKIVNWIESKVSYESLISMFHFRSY